MRRIAGFYARGFPEEFRRSLPYVAICTAITVACAVVAYVLVRNHPADAYAMLPKSLVPETIRKSLHDSNFAVDPTFAPAMSAMIIANNVKVAIVAFAGSVTLGALTVYIIAFNGLMLGGMAALFTNAGFGKDFWATIAPHGVIELTAIQIAGAAGLLIAAGALFPGRRRRRDVLVANARRAGTLIFGVASMLVVAGTIEAFVSPRRLPVSVRIAVGLFTAVVLVLYFRARAGVTGPLQQTAPLDAQILVDQRRRELLGRHVDDDGPGAFQHRLGDAPFVRQVERDVRAIRLAGVMRLLASAALTAASFMKTQISRWCAANDATSAIIAACASGSITSVRKTISERLCR